jgi:sodium/hydrogen exchanger-like protein 6/7
MGEVSEEKLQEAFYIMLMVILFLKFMVEALFAKINPPFGHNTGIIVIIGMLCSFAMYKMAGDNRELLQNLQFSEKLFFDIILPSIVFPSGFNMRRKKFFRNIKTISKFGFIATLFCFAIYSAALYGV